MGWIQALLQSILTVSVLISEYTLFFDHWVITAPAGPEIERQNLSPLAIKRGRWISALKTAIVYAISEPLWYWLITIIPWKAGYKSMGAVVMGAHIHLGAMMISQMEKLDCLKKMQEEHKTTCPEAWAKEEAEQAKHRPGLLPNGNGQSDEEKLLTNHTDENSTTPGSDEKTVHQPFRPEARCVTHQLGRSYHAMTYIPVSTAALSNAGLTFYCRYLTMPDSRDWLSRFAFGWTAIAGLALFCVICTKWMNSNMHVITFRPFIPTRTVWDAMQVSSCFAVVVLVRAALRSILGQSPFTLAAWWDSQSALVVVGSPMPGNDSIGHGTMDPSTSRKWTYFNLASSGCQILGWSAYIIYVILKRRRERRQGHVD